MSLKILVIGAGQMGAGIAEICLKAGYFVYLVDPSEILLQNFEEKHQDFKRSLESYPSIESVPVCADWIIEAVPENYDLKAKVMKEAWGKLATDGIYATNTSSISIAKLAKNADQPERVVGIHFMNPVPVMQVVEIIPALQTRQDVIQKSKEFATSLGKNPVMCKDFPGFILNRILLVMINEAIHCLETNMATAEDIDLVMKLGCNHPMGPLKLADFIGLDTCLAILNVLYEGFGEQKFKPSVLLSQYVEAGKLGRKSGQGFYTYQKR